MATQKLWKKIVAVVMAVLLAISSVPVTQTIDTYAATATKLYLKPNSEWTSASAWFAAYFFGNGDTWVKMTATTDGYYVCDVPSGYPSVIFCRMDPGKSALDWTSKWNQTADLTVPTDGTNCWTLNSGDWNGGGSWSTKIFGYYVAGSSGLCGENWSTTADPMTANSDGTYSITFSNVAAGNYTFKVVANGDYSAGSWPSSDYALSVSAASDVTITFNPSNSNISVTQTPLTCSHSYTSKVTTAASCTTDGVRTYTCSKCGDTYTEVITATGHTMVNGTCRVCGYTTISNYSVEFYGDNVTSSGASTANNGANYTATLTPASGYQLPASITVTVGGKTITSGYSYNSSTGALTINSSAITGDIVITAEATKDYYIVVGTQSLTGSNWDTGNTDNLMTKNADGTYTIVYSEVPAGTHEFKITENGQWKWPENNYVINADATSKITITYDPKTGDGTVTVESIYVRSDEVTLSPDDVYYANVDLVDYLNNNRVQNDQVKGYYTDNQGEWLWEEDAVFSFMNHLVSQQVSMTTDDGLPKYSYPLYFGPLHYIKSRYSKVVGSDDWLNLGNWSTAANVAFGIAGEEEEINSSAVAQGLVKNTLDADGNLLDAKTGTPLLYFNQEAAENWTNNNHKVMAYYPDLQFPFIKNYDEETRVTTYSYDSASDYAVYYDYTNPQLYASNTHVQDYKGNSGFYPLNAPTDKDNMVNNGFGAKFTIDFTVGDDGYLINGEPVTFEFTGDDDVWVFIDGVLVLDMGGAHAMANGKIDFAAQTATAFNAASVSDGYMITSGTTYDQSTYSGKGLENYIYDGYNDGIDVLERATLETADKPVSFTDLGLDFDYDSVHTMTVFYMERGMFESNFSMEFTMVPVPSGLTVSKNLNDAAINKGVLDAVSRADDLSFTLKATSPDSTSVAFSKYTLTDKYIGHGVVTVANGSTSGRTYTEVINGINNHVYAHSFVTDNGDDAFIPGTKFVITETTKGIFSYSGTTWAVYDANNGYQNITSSVKTSGYSTSGSTAAFTMGTTGSTTAYSYAVSFTNTMNLGNLQVTKNVSGESLEGMDFTFRVYLDLDGSGDVFSSAMYPGLVYTVNGTEYTSEDGTIIVPGGETAVISGLPAGATYTVEEVIPSGVNWVLSTSSGTTGTITTGGTKTASFTNTLEVGTLQITKVFNSDWLSGTKFTFTVSIDDSLYSGSYTIGGTTYTTTNGTITLSGGQTAVITGLPANATYEVEETVPGNAAWQLSSSSGTSGTITANGTKTASFTNTLKTGSLQISKVFSDSVLGDTEFTFTVKVDPDGSGTAYSSALYSGSYTVGGTTYSTTNGTITLCGGEAAVLSGLPAGATYEVVEEIPQNAPWHQVSKSGTTGTITVGGTAKASFTNAVNTVTENKVIYISVDTTSTGETRSTDYNLKYGEQAVNITSLTPGNGLTATYSGQKITVTGKEPDKAYTMTYQGRAEDGTVVQGTITVYTFKAMDKVYVFDFGLSSDLADTDYDDGLFQQDYLFNKYATGETATLYNITAPENAQTAIDYTKGSAIDENGKSAAVTFRPTAFMSRVDRYTYTVCITAPGETFDANNPETGCIVTGNLAVMPANSVYYEDNFNIDGDDASEKFIYSGDAPTTAPEGSQSNDQSSHYGYDDAYLGDYADSNDSSTVLKNMEYTYFTFTGTGFDLDSRTTADTAGMAVYVFEGVHDEKYLNYVVDFGSSLDDATKEKLKDMVFVNNYYANGDLYQVPVVSVRLGGYAATYTVYIQCLSTSYASSVLIDGVRIYDPLKNDTTKYPDMDDTSEYLLESEKNTTREELRVMYKEDRVNHAVKNGDTVAEGLGNCIVEMITGSNYVTSDDLTAIYKTGPNNEMYLPANCGLSFSYTVRKTDWTIQLGAKAVTATDTPKTISVWVRGGNDSFTRVDTIELTTTTDMYYDLTAALADYCEDDVSYDVIIISEESKDAKNEFVSLTTLKYSGVIVR